jgi:hypothetical protein
MAPRRAAGLDPEARGVSALKPPRPWPLDKSGKPKRRVAVPGNSGIYWRANGRFEVGYRDADGVLRWRGPFDTISAARAGRGDAKAKARGGERESANPRLRFGEAADRWLAEQVAGLRSQTRKRYRSHVTNHLRPRWGNRRMDAIDVTDAARLVRELRATGAVRTRWSCWSAPSGRRSVRHPSGASTRATSWRRRWRRRGSRGRRSFGSRMTSAGARASCWDFGGRTLT